jgi:hypothetical protein
MKSVLLSIFAFSITMTAACSNETNTGLAVLSTASLNASQLEAVRESPRSTDTTPTVTTVKSDPVVADQTPSTDEARQSQEAQIQSGLFPWRPANGDEISFKVLRKGNDFGTHKISFSGDPDGKLVVTSDVSLRAGLGPITVFRYTLEAQETWQDGVLVGLSGTTNDNGDRLQVEAQKQGDGLSVAGSEYAGDVDLGILPSSHWHKGQVAASQILSTEDGEVLDVTTQQVGREIISVAGRQVEADRYLLKSDIDLDLWYDTQNRLVKLAFEARGQNIEYVLTEPYGS